jgi:hypothetical protein
MEPKPVQNDRKPFYPTRREMLAGAASFALLNLTGLGFVFAESEEGKVTVAPVFKHGDGCGATGCVVVSPPVFLSEEEAMQIIREELAKHGIQLKGGSVLDGVRIPHRLVPFKFIGKEDAEKAAVECKKHANSLKLDGLDSEKHIAVEFVSKGRYFDLGGAQESYDMDELDDPDAKTDNSGGIVSSTAQSYDFKETAEFVVAKVKKQGTDQVFFGVFYDPLGEEWRKTGEKTDQAKLSEIIKMRKKSAEQKKDDSKKQLRLQAQDFVAWLKEQKAIQ